MDCYKYINQITLLSFITFQSDNQENEKSNFDIDNQGNDNGTREYVSSPGYDTSSTHPPSSPDLCEYTYEGAIQDYKSRVSRAQKSGFTNNFYTDNSPKDSNNESNGQAPRKQTSIQIENRLSNFEAKTSNDNEKNENLIKKNLPKVDIARRRELFEKDKIIADKQETEKVINTLVCDFSQAMSIKERLLNLESRNDAHESSNTKVDCLNTEFGSVKDRLLDIENASNNQNIHTEKHVPIDVPVVPLKQRLSSLQEVVPTNTNETVNVLSTGNDLSVSTDVIASDEQLGEINENGIIDNNNHVSLSVNDNDVEMDKNEISEEVQPNKTDEQPPVPEAIQEQPNRLLSTINEAIHLVEDQPENIVKRDSSVSWPNLLQTHVFDDIVVDNEVIHDVDDTSNTNPKSYLVMDSKSENIVHTSFTDDTKGKDILTSAGESLCISSNAIISDCCRQQPMDNEISNKVDTMYLRDPNDVAVESVISNVLSDVSDSNIQIVKPVESEQIPTHNGEINLNSIELKTIEESQDTKPSNSACLATDSVGCVKNNSTDNMDESKPIETFIQTENATTPVVVPAESPVSTSTPVEVLRECQSTKPVEILKVSPYNASVKVLVESQASTSNKPEEVLTESLATQSTKPVEASTECLASPSTSPIKVSTDFSASLSTKPVNVSTESLVTPTTTPVAAVLTESSAYPSFTKESSESKNNRIKCQIVGVLEKNKCPNDDASTSRSKLTLNTTPNDSLPSPDQSLLQSPSKTPNKSSKTIFDFIKRNLLNDPLPVTKEAEIHSTFYIPLIEGNGTEKKQSNICYDDIVGQSSEINNLIDEELEKLD